MNNCPHCGMIHQTTCPRIKAIEYNQDGVTVKRVEFHAPLLIALEPTPHPIFYGPNTSSNYGSSALSNACDQDEGA